MCVETKICSKCQKELTINDFYKGHYECKKCSSMISKEYRKSHKEQIKNKRKEYYDANKEKENEQNKKYREENRDRILEYKRHYHETHKEEETEQWKKYYQSHKEDKQKYRREHRTEHNERHKKRRLEDDMFKLSANARCRIYNAFKQNGYKKDSHTEDIIGCDFDTLKDHLENTWLNNYGTPYNGEQVHVDHVVPLSSANSKEELESLCHYTNLQYLTPDDNLKKNDKLDWNIKGN